MTFFLITVTLVMTLLSLIWSSKDWGNLALKAFLVGLAFWSLFHTMSNLGFVVQLPRDSAGVVQP